MVIYVTICLLLTDVRMEPTAHFVGMTHFINMNARVRQTMVYISME